MHMMLATETTIFFQRQFVRRLFLVLGSRVIPLLALGAR
jgi:hypothetical protein